MGSAKKSSKQPKKPAAKKPAAKKPAAKKPAAKKPAAKKPAAKKPAAKVEVTVDRALKRRWDEAVSAMRDARSRESSGFDAYWEAVGAVIDHDPPLYLAGGCATVGDFLTRHVGESERTARRNIRVARFASPQEEARYTVTKLDAALGWLEANGLTLAQGKAPIDFAALRIPVVRGEKAERLGLQEATVEEINAATAALRAAEGRSRRGSTPEIDAVTTLLKKDRALRTIAVSFRDGAFTFRHVSVDALLEFARTLAKVKLPR